MREWKALRFPFNGDINARISQMNETGSMDGVYFHVTDDQGGGTWRIDRKTKGTFRILDEEIVFEVLKKGKAYTPSELEGILGSMAAGWPSKSLSELEKSHHNLSRRMRRTESSREVYVAVWKASPYFVISLITAFLSAYLYLNVPELAFFLGLAILIVIETTVGVWFASRDQDSYIATLSIYSDKIVRTIGERMEQVRKDFLDIRNRLPKVAIDISSITFADYIRVISDKSSSLESKVRVARLSDMNHRYPGLISKIRQIYLDRNEFSKHITSFYSEAYDKVKCLVPDGDSHDTQDRMDKMLKAFYLVCAGSIPTRADLAIAKSHGFYDSYDCIEKILSDDIEFSSIRQDPRLVKLAVRAASELKFVIELHEDVTATIEYSFGRS